MNIRTNTQHNHLQYKCSRVCTYVYACVHTSLSPINVNMYVHIRTHMHACTCTYVYVCAYGSEGVQTLICCSGCSFWPRDHFFWAVWKIQRDTSCICTYVCEYQHLLLTLVLYIVWKIQCYRSCICAYVRKYLHLLYIILVLGHCSGVKGFADKAVAD